VAPRSAVTRLALALCLLSILLALAALALAALNGESLLQLIADHHAVGTWPLRGPGLVAPEGEKPELVTTVFGIALLTALTLGAIAVVALVLRFRRAGRLVNRTLAYGVLTVLLGAVYGGLVLVLGQLSGGIGGTPPSWAAAAATLAVATLFQPARRRVQPEPARLAGTAVHWQPPWPTREAACRRTGTASTWPRPWPVDRSAGRPRSTPAGRWPAGPTEAICWRWWGGRGWRRSGSRIRWR
jgi:hypothetical protein